MSKLSLDTFLALARRSQLVDDDRLAQVVNDWKRGATLVQLDDASYLADHLVDCGLMTHWQAHKLLDGRHRGFFLGKYRLLDHLGSGGMSSVYLAEHTLMQRLVAIKVLPQHRVRDASYVARFQLEGQCTAALDHPNIVRAYDLDSEGKIHYLVMEFVDGRDLQALVEHAGPLDFHSAADYIAQAAAGLDHAHAAGLVHRDIKPANLLLDRHGTIKILDMGLAKFGAAKGVPADLENDENVLGTADYVAPEQAINSSAVDHRADIYSLGCTLYFLLTGHPPFAAGSPAQRMAAHRGQAPPSLLLERPDVPQPLLAICRRMMEKSPLARYQSAAEVHAALSAWLATEVAAGRVRQTAAALAVHGGAPSGSFGERSGSKINLITGSSGKLERHGVETEPLDSTLSDTQPNVGATQLSVGKTPSVATEAAHALSSQSHVLHTEVARLAEIESRARRRHLWRRRWRSPPRRCCRQLLILRRHRRLRRACAVQASPAATVEVPLVHRPTLVPKRRTTPRSKAPWLWVSVLIGLIFTAVLAALYALSA